MPSDIGVWRRIEEGRTCPIAEMQVEWSAYYLFTLTTLIEQVWDGLTDARITFNASELGLDPLKSGQMARLTENLNLQRGLLRHLNDVPEISVLEKVKVSSIEQEQKEGGGWPLVRLSDGKVIRARLLVRA